MILDTVKAVLVQLAVMEVLTSIGMCFITDISPKWCAIKNMSSTPRPSSRNGRTCNQNNSYLHANKCKKVDNTCILMSDNALCKYCFVSAISLFCHFVTFVILNHLQYAISSYSFLIIWNTVGSVVHSYTLTIDSLLWIIWDTRKASMYHETP